MKERVKMVSSSFLKAAAAPHSALHALPNVASAVSSRATVKTFFDGRCLKNNVMSQHSREVKNNVMGLTLKNNVMG